MTVPSDVLLDVLFQVGEVDSHCRKMVRRHFERGENENGGDEFEKS